MEKARGKTVRIHKARLIEGVLAALIIISLLNLFIIYTLTNSIASEAKPAETPKPAELSITKISASCTDCFDIGLVVSAIKQAGVSVQSEKAVDYSSTDAKQLVAKYNISRLPALVITGDIEKADLSQFGEKVGDAYVFRQAPPPFADASTGKTVGIVSLAIVSDPSCRECFDMSTLSLQLQQAGVKVSGTKAVDSTSDEGRELVSRYALKKLPAAILSNDLSAYEEIAQGWGRLGTVEPDGSFILREVAPPYVSVDTGEVKGKVSIISLNDSACSSCYDVSVQSQILVRMGLFFSENSTVDINSTEGKQLIAKYNITSVPTVVFSPEAAVYPLLGQVWPQVGTVESDGWFVFRNMAAIRGATYRDLPTGEIKTAAAPAAPQQ